jgi:diguanylate cyclase (GGDEF)-like protein
MSAAGLQLLLVGIEPALAEPLAAAGLQVREGGWAQAAGSDAVVATAAAVAADEKALAQAAFDSAVVVLAQPAPLDTERAWLQSGVEAIVTPGDAAALVRAIHHAVARKQLERAARRAYATDLATGLPHQAQLLEHMTQLLALREREPGPMVLLVLRVEGFQQAAAKLGAESGNVLRRKVAVRLRGLLRASDVVAAVGSDAFGVLLGRLESKGDGERVATKLVRALQQPLLVAGQPCSVAAAVGMAQFPEHGSDAATLLQRASAQAGSVATVGVAGFAGLTRREAGSAANDPSPD